MDQHLTESQAKGRRSFGTRDIVTRVEVVCARSRLLTMWLRQMSERCARTSSDDTADAGHFALRKPQTAPQVEASGRYSQVLTASALPSQVPLGLPEGDRLPHSSSPGPAAVASSHADFVSKTHRGHLQYREICITQ